MHLKDILNLKRKGGAHDIHQQLLNLKEENSKLKELVQKEGSDAQRLAYENNALKSELGRMRSPNSAHRNHHLPAIEHGSHLGAQSDYGATG